MAEDFLGGLLIFVLCLTCCNQSDPHAREPVTFAFSILATLPPVADAVKAFIFVEIITHVFNRCEREVIEEGVTASTSDTGDTLRHPRHRWTSRG